MFPASQLLNCILEFLIVNTLNGIMFHQWKIGSKNSSSNCFNLIIAVVAVCADRFLLSGTNRDKSGYSAVGMFLRVSPVCVRVSIDLGLSVFAMAKTPCRAQLHVPASTSILHRSPWKVKAGSMPCVSRET